MDTRLPLVGLLLLCLAACVAAPVRAPAAKGVAMVSVPLPLGETYSGGEPLSRVAPVYPPTMVQTCPAQQDIDAVVYVNADGTVSDVIEAVIDMVVPPQETFFAAVRPALMQWRFEPLRVENWAADAAGNAHAVDGGARRFARRYSFRFSCHDGKTSVSGKAGGARVYALRRTDRLPGQITSRQTA